MSVELKIKWDGDVVGLAEHRLSIGAFGLPLYKLLMAIRRAASNIVRDAVDMREVSVGRFASDADRIDIEIQSLVTGSSGIQGLVEMQYPPPGMQIPFPFDKLPEQATDRILDAIDKEIRGTLSNKGVRSYLESLPHGITKQEYAMSVDGEVKRLVSFGIPSLPEPITELPHLAEMLGKVIGVGFEPGRNWVRIQGDTGEVTLNAEAASVDIALEMRNSDVRALYVSSGDHRRLLRMTRPDEPRKRLDVDKVVFRKWHSVLEALAQ